MSSSYALETSAERTWFTAQRMKKIGLTLVTLDILLILLWCAGSLEIAVYLSQGVPCYVQSATVHFLILIHFALAMFLTSQVSGILDIEDKARRKHKQPPVILPPNSYYPLSWSFTALISTAGDGTLLTWAIIDLVNHPSGFDECNTTRILHTLFDALALAVSVVTVLWFIAFALCTLKPPPRVSRHKKVQ